MAGRKRLVGGAERAVDLRKELEVTQRRTTVAANILAGATYRDIAGALDVSLSTVAEDVKAMLAEWRQHYIEDIEEWAHVQLRRYDVLFNAHWDKAKSGDHEKATEVVLKVMDKQSQLLGLNSADTVNQFNIILKWPEERDADKE